MSAVHAAAVPQHVDALITERSVSRASRNSDRGGPAAAPRRQATNRRPPVVHGHPPRRRIERARARPAAARALPSRQLTRIRSVVGFARAQVGDPYRYSGARPGGWDCSGLTKGAFSRAGVRLPHKASRQSARGHGVTRRAARAGDLVLWGGVGRAYHVGIYLGGGRVLHSPRPGRRVSAAPLWGSPQFRRLL